MDFKPWWPPRQQRSGEGTLLPFNGRQNLWLSCCMGLFTRKQSSLSGKESAQGCTPKRLLGRPDDALGEALGVGDRQGGLACCDSCTTRRGTATPVHRPQRPAGSTHSSTRGLRPPEHLRENGRTPAASVSDANFLS